MSMVLHRKVNEVPNVVLNKDGTPRKRMGRPPKPRPAKKKRGVGRPHKLNDDEKTMETLNGLAKIQCTVEEAAGVMHVCKDTFIEFLDRSKKAKETWEFGKQEGKASLRRIQLKTALGGNATMQVWLGKQLLGQKDRHEHTGEDGGPIRFVYLDTADQAA